MQLQWDCFVCNSCSHIWTPVAWNVTIMSLYLKTSNHCSSVIDSPSVNVEILNSISVYKLPFGAVLWRQRNKYCSWFFYNYRIIIVIINTSTRRYCDVSCLFVNEYVMIIRVFVNMCWGLISRKWLEIETCLQLQWSTCRKRHMANRMVTWSMTSLDTLRVGAGVWRRLQSLPF